MSRPSDRPTLAGALLALSLAVPVAHAAEPVWNPVVPGSAPGTEAIITLVPAGSTALRSTVGRVAQGLALRGPARGSLGGTPVPRPQPPVRRSGPGDLHLPGCACVRVGKGDLALTPHAPGLLRPGGGGLADGLVEPDLLARGVGGERSHRHRDEAQLDESLPATSRGHVVIPRSGGAAGLTPLSGHEGEPPTPIYHASHITPIRARHVDRRAAVLGMASSLGRNPAPSLLVRARFDPRSHLVRSSFARWRPGPSPAAGSIDLN